MQYPLYVEDYKHNDDIGSSSGIWHFENAAVAGRTNLEGWVGESLLAVLWSMWLLQTVQSLSNHVELAGGTMRSWLNYLLNVG